MKKSILLTSILATSLMPSFVEATASKNVLFDTPSLKEGNPKSIELKELIENVFKVVTDMKAVNEDYAQYISKDYVQCVDGEILKYNGFIDHMKALKKSVKSLTIVFHDVITEGNKVVTRHTAYAVKKNNKEVEVQVIAIFEVKDGKIISCNELTHMRKGETADRDLGSRR